MSEEKIKNPSDDKEVKQTTSIKSENPEADLKEMKKWADSQKKKEEEPLTKKQKPNQNKQASSKGQPAKKPTNKSADKAAAKEMPKVGVTTKKPAAKPVQKTAPKQAAKSVPTAKKGKKKHNYLVWAAVVVVLIPCLLLLYILIGSLGSSDEPIEGSRFKGSLDPEISQEEITTLQSSLSLENVESINITLKSATLRVLINTNDDLSQDSISEIMASAYEQIVEKFPVETYFQNRTENEKFVKMYDLDIEVYNYIPTGDEDSSGQIHMSRTKNSSAEAYVDDILTTAKDETTADELLNPDTSTPPSEDGNESEEGE